MVTAAVSKIGALRPIQWGILLGVTLVGFVLRVIEIDRWPLWGDEGMTLLIAQRSYLQLFFVPVDPTPGLYYALHKLLLGPAVDAAAARSISLVAGTLTIPAAWWLAREARVPALLGAALVALSFPLIDYSQEARAYAVLVLLVTCSAIFFIRWTRSRSAAQLLPALLFGLLATYTHLAAIFWVGPMCAAILWTGKRQALLPLILFALLVLPELRRLLAYRSDIFSWLAEATPAEAADTVARALLPFQASGWWAAAIALLLGWRVLAHRQPLKAWAQGNPGAAYALAVLLAAPLLVWAFGLAAKPIFMTRTILIAIPGFMLAISLLLRFEHRLARFAAVALYAASLLATGTTRPKEDWREIAARVGGDTILLCQLSDAAAMRHALGRDNRVLLRYDGGLIEVWGEPWPERYFEILSSKRRLAEGKRRGAAVSLDSYPVWPVRSGKIWQMAAKPTTLRQAIVYCDSVRLKDREARYIAE